MTLKLKRVDREPLGKRRWQAYIQVPENWTDVVDANCDHEDDPPVLVITAATPDVLDELSKLLADAAEEARSLTPIPEWEPE